MRWYDEGSPYRFVIRCGSATFEVSGTNEQDVRATCIEWAARHGYKPVRWWQFWRCGDTRITQAEIEAAIDKAHQAQEQVR